MSADDWMESPPKDETTFRATVAPDGAVTFERKPWDQVGSKHPKFGAFIPLMSLVSNETIEDFFTQLSQPFCEYGKPRVFEIVEVHGSSVKVHSRDWPFGAWRDYAEFLLGTGKPCEDFNIRGSHMYARLKTARVYEIEAHMLELGGVWGSFKNGFGEFLFREGAKEGNATPAPAEAHAKRKKKIPEGAATFVMRVMQRDMPAGTIEIDDLLERTAKIMPPKIDKEGKNRTKKYISAAIEKLVSLELLHLHDQTKISLTALVVGDQ